MIIGGLPRANLTVTVAEGREVTLDRIYIDYTYEGVLEGDPSLQSHEHWFQDAVDAAQYHFHLRGRATRGRGIFLIEPTLRHTPPYPSRPHVPYVRVFAFCSSWHNGRGSALALVWFQDSMDDPLLERFSTAVKIPAWDRVAIRWEE